MSRGSIWRLGVCLTLLGASCALAAACGGHAHQQAGYLGRDSSSVVFLQWSRAGDTIGGSISVAGVSDGNVRQLTQPISGTIDGSRVTLTLPSTLSSTPLTATVSGSHLRLGNPINEDLSAATVADYDAAAVALIPSISQDELAQSARETAVREGIHSIQIGIQSYAVDHADSYPSFATPTTIGQYVDTWPQNPYTNAPTTLGTDPGNYSYSTNGSSFQLVGYGSDGQALITVP
jgi:hypothetical protein